jgi:hypothetical protein
MYRDRGFHRFRNSISEGRRSLCKCHYGTTLLNDWSAVTLLLVNTCKLTVVTIRLTQERMRTQCRADPLWLGYQLVVFYHP